MEENVKNETPLYEITIKTINNIEKMVIGNSIHSQLRGNIDYINNSIILNVDEDNTIKMLVFPDHKTPLPDILVYFPDEDFNNSIRVQQNTPSPVATEKQKTENTNVTELGNNIINHHLDEFRIEVLKMFEDKIKDVSGTISNERLWALGSGIDTEKIHLENIKYLTREKNILERIKTEMNTLFDRNRSRR